MEFVITTHMKALEALRQLYPDSSRRTLQGWIKAGRFTLDGKPLKNESILLEKGQTLSSQTTFQKHPASNIPILFEDPHLIVINKPVGLLSVPLDNQAMKRSALEVLRTHFNTEDIYAVHRIDRETSGALLFARGKKSAEYFNILFEKHDLKREYFAIAHGDVSKDTGTWECPLLELPSFDVIESPDGKMATTHYEVYRRSAKYTYIKLTLETGKKHQIRVHCRRAGHPIVGDKRYGSTENPLKRLCLHALSLEFIHPFTKKTLSVKAPLPKAFHVLGGQVIPK